MRKNWCMDECVENMKNDPKIVGSALATILLLVLNLVTLIVAIPLLTRTINKVGVNFFS